MVKPIDESKYAYASAGLGTCRCGRPRPTGFALCASCERETKAGRVDHGDPTEAFKRRVERAIAAACPGASVSWGGSLPLEQGVPWVELYLGADAETLRRLRSAAIAEGLGCDVRDRGEGRSSVRLTPEPLPCRPMPPDREVCPVGGLRHFKDECTHGRGDGGPQAAGWISVSPAGELVATPAASEAKAGPARVNVRGGRWSGKTAEMHRAIGEAVADGKSVYVAGRERDVIVRPEVVDRPASRARCGGCNRPVAAGMYCPCDGEAKAGPWSGTLVLTRLLWAKGESTQDRIRDAFRADGERMVQVWLETGRGGQRYDLVKGSAWIHDQELDAMAAALNGGALQAGPWTGALVLERLRAAKVGTTSDRILALFGPKVFEAYCRSSSLGELHRLGDPAVYPGVPTVSDRELEAVADALNAAGVDPAPAPGRDAAAEAPAWFVAFCGAYVGAFRGAGIGAAPPDWRPELETVEVGIGRDEARREALGAALLAAGLSYRLYHHGEGYHSAIVDVRAPLTPGRGDGAEGAPGGATSGDGPEPCGTCGRPATPMGQGLFSYDCPCPEAEPAAKLDPYQPHIIARLDSAGMPERAIVVPSRDLATAVRDAEARLRDRRQVAARHRANAAGCERYVADLEAALADARAPGAGR